MSYVQWQEDQDYQCGQRYDDHNERWASETESMRRMDIMEHWEEISHTDPAWFSLCCTTPDA